MRYCSASSWAADPYRAGVELGQRLEPLPPEIVLLFCTVHYIEEFHDLLAGLRDVLGPGVLVCGGTGDGIYESAGAENHGVCALAIQTEGQSKWKAALVHGVQSDSALAVENAVSQVQAELGAPISLAFILADGMKADGSQIAAQLGRLLQVPCFGGLSGDDRQFKRCPVFLNEQIATDAVLLLAASGRVPIRLNAASGWKPVGDFGRVTQADGQVLVEIDGRPASAFLQDQAGKTVGGMGLTALPLAEYTSDNSDQFVLRSASQVATDGRVTLFGRISRGSRVRICHATLDEILGGVDSALRSVTAGDFTPGAVVVISCASRKWLLAENGREEVERTVRRLGMLPLIGIPSYGEIAPFRCADGACSRLLFHNMTFVVSVLGR